jgi:hypothetical protein
MIVNDSKFVAKIANIHYCKLCDYSTCNSYDFNKHLSTDKHKKRENGSDLVVNDSDFVAKVAQTYTCICGKKYKYASGYYRHKKVCDKANNGITSELVIALINDNKEMKQIILEQNTTISNLVKNGITNNMNNSHNTYNNNKFNLNFFLNETCKNAMNINEFIDSIKVELIDLERFGNLGYVENLSNIISTNLKALDVTERPVHCTDKKRETIYIKDENKWSKDDNKKTQLRKAIKKIASKNFKLITEYREKYPGCEYADSKYSDKYNKMIVEVMGGTGDGEDKIIKNLSKNIIIERKTQSTI